jgi:PAS domain S-box-containing protein
MKKWEINGANRSVTKPAPWLRYGTRVVLVAGFMITVAGTWFMQSNVKSIAEQEFLSESLQCRNIIAYRLGDHARVLLGGAALFQASDVVTREEWRVFTQHQNLEKQLPGSQGMGFALWIPPAELARHIQEIRSEGYPDYAIKPEGEREFYSSIIYLQPFTGRNLRAFGYDMFSESVRRAAMEKSRDTNAAALSGKVVLVQETDQDVQAGTLMYVPVYRKGLPIDSVEERRAAIYGWVYSPYRMNDLLRGILTDHPLGQRDKLCLEVYDGTSLESKNRLYGTAVNQRDTLGYDTRLTRRIPVDFNGQVWTLNFTRIDDGVFTVAYIRVWLTLAGGMIITMLVAAMIHLLLRTNKEAQRIAHELTADLHTQEELLRSTTQRLTLAVRAGGVGIWDYDVVQNLLVWDEQMYRLYGITRDQFGGAYEAWQSGLHPEDRQRGDAEIQLALKGHRDFDVEFRVLWPNGTIRHIRGFAAVERDAEGRPLRMVGTNWDITDRKLAEEELAKLSVIQGELMRLATEFVNVPLRKQDAAIDQSLQTIGKLIHADRAYLFSYDFEKGLMHNTHEWCDSGITPEICNLQDVPISLFPDWVEAHQAGEWVHISSVASLPSGSALKQVLEPQGIHSLITLPLMQGKSCLGFVGFDAAREERIWQEEEVALLRVLAELYAHFEARRTDERAAHELQQQLIQARDAAQAGALAKSLFLANMSHEIRTPLNVILGYAQIMERECRACPTTQRLSAITRSGEHLLELLNDLLEWVRGEDHEIILSPAAFDFYQILDDVRLIFANHPQARNLSFELSHAPDVPQFIIADSGKVRQILVNLLSNAVKFTSEGTVRLLVSLLSADKADRVMIAVDVEDTGYGIAAHELESIFDIFGQAERGRMSGKGTGLGLPLSRRYAQALGGDVTVSSRVGEGSCFRFTFQARIVNGVEVTELLRQGNVTRLADGQSACHVLVVDDERENLEMLDGMLSAVGFTVETVADAEQALERLREDGVVDLVLLDKCLPKMSGYEVIRHMRELPHRDGLVVLVVTASGFADEKELALGAGADGYVGKPVRRDRLLAEIARVAGVQYEYDEVIPGDSMHLMAATDLEATELACLPLAQREILDRALRRGDIQQLRDLISAIECEHTGLAIRMRMLVDTYNYDRLRDLLESIPKQAT